MTAVAATLAVTVWKRREFSFAVLLLTIFALSVAAPVTEHALLGTLYPLERVALGYLPLTGLLVVFSVDQILSKGWRERRIASIAVGTVSAMLILVMVAHFATTANLSHTFTWQYDSETKMAVMEIPNHFDVSNGHVVRIDSHWLYNRRSTTTAHASILIGYNLSRKAPTCFTDPCSRLRNAASLTTRFCIDIQQPVISS